MNKKILIYSIGFLFLIFSVNFVLAEFSSCCEKTLTGAWCQNAPSASCNPDYRSVPTSCEATSYCRLGTCYESQEGTCLPNTPEQVCQDQGGVWAEGEPDEVPQCSLGCCLIGDQAAFVTQTRCKRLSLLYGLEINFRTDIRSELTCIASATPQAKGACVFEKDFEKTCSFVTKEECLRTSVGNSSNVNFHEGYLCSADTLGTNCAPTQKTICVDGKDEVYFVDSCGNLANIYDVSKSGDSNYWSEIYEKSESCNSGNSNADSATCGNCDYFLGSTCKPYERVTDRVRPNQGDNICRDLSCEYEGEDYNHGETWCAEAKGTDDNVPGSRYFRLVCYNGDVSVEPCADFRQETCIESEINGFKAAACRVNMWQDCYAQDNQKDCENEDRRDCEWVNDGIGEQCLPVNSPGFSFWESEGEAESLCDRGSRECIVVFEKKLTGDKECIENCECLSSSWEDDMNSVCSSLGDCGTNINYLGMEGY